MSNRNQRNILAVYEQATSEEIADGMMWYAAAHCAADDLHIGPRVGAGVVAALSPGLRWEVNIEAARRVIAREDVVGLGVRYSANLNKAYRIIMGEAPETVLGGNKVRAFYRCILTPTNRHAVCVDGHAFGIWSAKRIPVDKIPSITDRGYNLIARDYVEATRTLRILPNQLQAIAWVTWRRIHNV